jgi:hypothetical protein
MNRILLELILCVMAETKCFSPKTFGVGNFSSGNFFSCNFYWPSIS